MALFDGLLISENIQPDLPQSPISPTLGACPNRAQHAHFKYQLRQRRNRRTRLSAFAVA